jgi:hypothetical protein
MFNVCICRIVTLASTVPVRLGWLHAGKARLVVVVVRLVPGGVCVYGLVVGGDKRRGWS